MRLDCGAHRGFRDKVRGSTNLIYTVTSIIGSHFSDLQKLLHGVDRREPDLITDLGQWANRNLPTYPTVVQMSCAGFHAAWPWEFQDSIQHP